MDFLGIITRLRPGSRYLWRDGGSTYADILEWQDPETTKPTEIECLAEWDVMLAERAEAKAEVNLLIGMESTARTAWKDLGVWSTWEPQQAQDYVRNAIFDGINQDGLDNYIDTNVIDMNSARVALKLLGANILTIRTILGIMAKVILYIRDILIKRL